MIKNAIIGLTRSIAIGIAACFLVMGSGCSRRPAHVLSDSKTSELLADLFISEAYVQSNPSAFHTDSARKVLRQSVLADHGVTQEDLDSTLAWYGRHIDDYVKLYDDVDKRIAKRRERFMSDRSVADADRQTLWPYSPVQVLMRGRGRTQIGFSLDSTAVSVGDRLNWNMYLRGMNKEVTLVMGAEYPDGEVRYQLRNIRSEGKGGIEFQTDSLKKPERIYGYLYIDPSETARVWLDSIKVETEPFEREEYGRIHTQRREAARRGGKNTRVDNMGGETDGSI